MSQKSANPIPGIDWLETQKQYMDAWKSFTRFLPQGDSGMKMESNPWVDAMDAWWKSVSGNVPATSEPFMNKMLEQGKVFYMLSEHFMSLLQQLDGINKASEDWQELINDQFNELKNFFDGSDRKDSLNGMLGAWQLLPLDTLHRTFSSASVMPGDFLEEFKPQDLQEVTDKFLSMPGVGYTRESQEQAQEGVRLWVDYQKATQNYNNLLTRVGIEAVERMRKRILEMAETGEEIHTLRQIYDIWVDCNEEAYANLAHSDEFSELYGEVTNALMGIKRYSRNVVDEMLAALNMPTRKGINTMQQRQQELRRDFKVANRKIETLEEELSALKHKMDGDSAGAGRGAGRKAGKKKTTRSSSGRTPSGKKTSKRKSTAKKKTAKKKTGKKKTAKKKLAGKKASRKSGNDMITIKI